MNKAKYRYYVEIMTTNPDGTVTQVNRNMWHDHRDLLASEIIGKPVTSNHSSWYRGPEYRYFSDNITVNIRKYSS